MRLLRSDTLAFETFLDERKLPKYAILSHTWGDKEVSYHDFLVIRSGIKDALEDPAGWDWTRILALSLPSCSLGEGLWKIFATAKQAHCDAIMYFWIDTCCINKDSSAELSEAINSMYKWYEGSEICYAYLSDVPLDANVPEMDPDCFVESRWFTRGWTLQELLAPRNIMFFSSSWQTLGSKSSLQREIRVATKIPDRVLSSRAHVADFSMAVRMSWAARRETTRVEDMAYCLMGIFDVNMPLLYGEGEKAFLRLQEEIIKTSDDLTIFAWKAIDSSLASWRGLLAKSPAEFHDSEAYYPLIESNLFEKTEATLLTNKGIKIALRLRLRRSSHPRTEGEYIATLECTNGNGESYCIYLQQVSSNEYVRLSPDLLPSIHSTEFLGEYEMIYIRPTLSERRYPKWNPEAIKSRRIHGIILRNKIAGEFHGRLDMQVEPSHLWVSDRSHLLFDQSHVMGGPLQAHITLRDLRRQSHAIISLEFEGSPSDSGVLVEVTEKHSRGVRLFNYSQCLVVQDDKPMIGLFLTFSSDDSRETVY